MPPSAQIGFTENKGQWQSSILYKGDIPGGHIRIKKSGFEYQFVDFERLHDLTHGRKVSPQLNFHLLCVNFVGASPLASITGSLPTESYSNYFYGNDPAKWVSEAYDYKQLYFDNLYPGIDLRLYSKGTSLKYDVELAAKADLRLLQIKYEGAESMQLKNGRLVIKTSLNEISEIQPLAWQTIRGKKVYISCNYRLSGNVIDFVLGSNYNANYPLTIDPNIVFSSYTGSKADNFGFTATYDTAGNTYVGGIVYDYEGIIVGGVRLDTLMPRDSFPVSPGAYQTSFRGGNTDIVIFKFSPDGTDRKYATYLGGTDSETPHSMIVNSKNELILFGATGSANFPTKNGHDNTFNSGNIFLTNTDGILYLNGTDIYVAKLNEAGTDLLASTYIGGSGNEGIDQSFYKNVIFGSQIFVDSIQPYYTFADEFRGEVVIDKDDNVYVASVSNSTNFPVTSTNLKSSLSGKNDGVVSKLDPNLQKLLFSGYFGGNGSDGAITLDIDRNQNLFICGNTSSTNNTFINPPFAYKTTPSGKLDGFVISIDSSGNGRSGTYLGTSENDKAIFVRVDFNNDVHVLGQTWGQYPVSITSGFYSNPGAGQFIHKLDNSLSRSIYSTTFGTTGKGKPDISPTAFLVNKCGILMLAGWMGDLQSVISVDSISPSTMPVTPGALQSINLLNRGFYFGAFSPNMKTLDYGTYFSSGAVDHVDGGTSRFDPNGIIYQAICAGCQKDSDIFAGFPQTPTYGGEVWSKTNNSANCNMMGVKFDFQYKPLQTRITTIPPDVLGTVTGLAPLKVEFYNGSNKKGTNTSYSWRLITALDDELASKSPVAWKPEAFDEMDIYKVLLIGLDSTCNSKDNTIAYRDTSIIYVLVNPTITGATICNGDSGTFRVLGGYRYAWSPQTGLNRTDTSVIKVWVPTETMYNVTVTARNSNYTKVLQAPVAIRQVKAVADFRITPDSIGNIPFTINLFNTSRAAAAKPKYHWDFGEGSVSSATGPSFTFQKMGRYAITLTMQDTVSGCNAADTIIKYAYARPFVNDVLYCPEGSGQFSITGGNFFQWQDPAPGLNRKDISNPTVSVAKSMQYSVLVSTEQDVPYFWTYELNPTAGPYPSSPLDFKILKTEKSVDNETVYFDTVGRVSNYIWYLANGQTSTESAPIVNYTTEKPYVVTLTGIDSHECRSAIEKIVDVQFLKIPNIFTPNGDNVNDVFQIKGMLPGTATLDVYNRYGDRVFESGTNNYQNNWAGENLTEGLYYYLLRLNYQTSTRTYNGWVQILK